MGEGSWGSFDFKLLGGKGRGGCEFCGESRSCLKLGEHGWGWSVGADVCRKNV